MKRKRRKNKNDIIIDLTSMLDVIFIVLLVVMVGQKTAGMQQDKDSAQQVQEYNEAIDLYRDAKDTSTYFKSASVSVPYDETEIQKRTIKILFWGDEDFTEFKLVGINTDDVFNEFTECLEEYISGCQDSPVILSLNDDDGKILYRDEKRITGIIMELSEKYENVYIKGNLGEVE